MSFERTVQSFGFRKQVELFGIIFDHAGLEKANMHWLAQCVFYGYTIFLV